MTKFTEDELNTILEQHKLWLEDSSSGKRASLSGADLWDADLSYADLSYANLSGVDLRGADLWDADLSYANLRHANLRHADLCSASLYLANLSGADLRHANLKDANLWGTDLGGANLGDAMGNMKQVKSLQIDTYSVTYTKDVIQIGCQQNSIPKWSSWKENKDWIKDMDDGALEWAEKNLDFVLEIVKKYPAI